MSRMRWVYCNKDSVKLTIVKKLYIDVRAISINNKEPPLPPLAGLLLSLAIKYFSKLYKSKLIVYLASW